MEKVKIELTNEELEVVYRSLLELPAKISLPIIQTIEGQIRKQESKQIKDSE
jgi:hypothetical protein